MANVSQVKDLGAYCTTFYATASQTAAGAPTTVVAGGTPDGTKVTGDTIDTAGLYASGILQISYLAALANTKTLSFAIEYQESDDNSSWDTAVVVQAATVCATGDGVSSNFAGMVQSDITLYDKKRYIRFNITPDLSASGTDTAGYGVVLTAGGADHVPQT